MITPAWNRCGRSFKGICWLENRLLPPAGCSTGRGGRGSLLMWMEPDKLRALVRSRSWSHCLLSIVVSRQSARQASLRRKRGEVVRTRTVILQAHTHQFLGTFGGPGNGDYRQELLRAIGVITCYATQLGLPTASVLLRLDGHDARRCSADRCPPDWPWGDCFARRDYRLLDLEEVTQALACSPDQVSTHEDKWDDACALRLPGCSSDANWA